MALLKKDIEAFLKTVSTMEGQSISNLSEEDLVIFLATSAEIADKMDELKEVAKNELKAKEFKGVSFVPKLQRKVSLHEGKKSTSYNILPIWESMKEAGHEKNFFKIINVQKGLVDKFEDPEVKEIVEKYSHTDIGNSYITVTKMTKKELIEHRS